MKINLDEFLIGLQLLQLEILGNPTTGSHGWWYLGNVCVEGMFEIVRHTDLADYVEHIVQLWQWGEYN